MPGRTTLTMLAMTLLAAVMLAGCMEPSGSDKAPARTTAPEPPVAQPEPVEPIETAPPDPLRQEYAARIDELLPGMGAAAIIDRKDAQLELEKMCFEAGAPGKELERKALSEAMMACTGPRVAMPARVWILRKIEKLGRDEVVPELTRLLDDAEPRIRELARRALQNNPSAEAGAALRREAADALRTTVDAAWAVSLINALGQRRDHECLGMLIATAESHSDEAVARAAIAALGRIASPNGLKTLQILRDGRRPALKADAIDASLMAAGALGEEGRTGLAVAVYRDLLGDAQPERVRMAALSGLAKAAGAKALPDLLAVMKGDDPRLGLVAARCAQHIPGEAATKTLAAELDQLNAERQVLILDVLANRADDAALPAVRKRIRDDDPAVRQAALEAMVHVGNASVVELLATYASKLEGEDCEAVRSCLARLRGEGVDEAIMSQAETAEPAVRGELIRAAAARRIKSAVPLFFEAAESDDQAIRTAGISALASVAGPKELPQLVAMLTDAKDDATRDEAAETLIKVCSRVADRDERAAPVITALDGADPAAQAKLIHVLGEIRGESARQAVKSKIDSDNDRVKGTAIRALAGWDSPAPMATLLDVAKNAGNEKHKQIALGGYVRMVGMPSDRTPEQTFKLLNQAMELAADDKVKKQIITAMGDVPLFEAMNFVLAYLGQDALRGEASRAALRVAVVISGTHHDESVATIKAVQAMAEDDKVRTAADNALLSITGYCVVWQISSPHRAEGKKGSELIDHAFPPEKDGAELEWKPLAITNPNQPGNFDLGGQSDCCAYVKTSIWVPAEQKVQFGIGSDDGVKMWVNGEVVHTNNTSRAVNCGEDKIEATLKEGWNPVMLKITQGGGGWGFCCAVRNPDGTRLEDVRFKAE